MPRLGGSFRDPAGFVYTAGGTLYRQVNRVFAEEFEACTRAGLYDALVYQHLLVPHRRLDLSLALTPEAHAVLGPDVILFVSHPYEWCFGALRDAALLTLDIQLRALERGFGLRDASAHNAQFEAGRPIFIDTLSFERYRDGAPRAAYQRFCEHFVVPLALMAMRDPRFGLMLRDHLEGIPLQFGGVLLPPRTWANPRLLLHVHLHARAQRRYADATVSTGIGGRPRAKSALVSLVGSLRNAVAALSWRPHGTEWADDASATNYSEAAALGRRELVRGYLRRAAPRVMWDLGANTGAYSRIAREVASLVVAFDADPAAVKRNCRAVRAQGDDGLLPLVLDLKNPSPALGWAHHERMSLVERGPADTVTALALVDHLALSGNVPLDDLAAIFARLGRTLIVEFVAKTDSQVQRLLRNRPEIVPGYTSSGCQRAFSESFVITDCQRVSDAEHWPYLMTRCEPPSA